MYFEKRYQCTERDESGKLLSTGGFSSPEEFDRFVAQYPPVKGHTLTLYDSWTTLDVFGLFREVIRRIVGERDQDQGGGPSNETDDESGPA